MAKSKSEPTIVEKALQIKGFDQVVRTMNQQKTLSNHSQSTLCNYLRAISSLCLWFNRIPDNISDAEIREYLTELSSSGNSPSLSKFKHTVFGLRYYFRNFAKEDRKICLPPIKKEQRLPVILNQTELRNLFNAPRLFKHRLILSLIYSAGLRSSEVVNIRIADIDFERRTIHIHRSKHNRDRIVPLSNLIARDLRKYLRTENPTHWLFNGNGEDGKFSRTGLRWIMCEAKKKSSIKKDVNLHSLRHSYATHLLEQGVNIVTIKELLGHVDIKTTLTYLHVAQSEVIKTHSPIDRLYSDKKKRKGCR
ncbi:MAG TPA: tyrosine-type recombinase/integrase [Tenuifilaceae bacterium]|nr:tyrosine-type recombinase/integrase [Tenuifilaceae bacterium]HPE19691.1 tyrosine-type recombinase/integrase [Tenuifilaceae bacterium]HPJ47243.1 tyrosine-type recombinase/integrase [Tenuifilaceae bacterium]HRX68502.1 tyrosine-type recombinase/integrase [Tenuifilaceae bacterium]